MSRTESRKRVDNKTVRGWKGTIGWLATPQNHDYPAANSYLCLLFDESSAARFVKRLRSAKVTEFKAKDIFRASQLSLLGVSNSHVKKDMEKIEHGQELSPLLLVRDTRASKLIIADGYHRLCAVYMFDEDAVIPCKIV
jgi:disulfide oxidoreductase YuzD